MKIALVHDYLNEYGGAEKVLRQLADMYPKAPIYTAFRVRGGTADSNFRDRKIVESKWAWLIKRGRLYSPLRFLLPSIWKSMDLSAYDLVITSCSGYIARGFKVGDHTRVIAYCHTPPRNLYGLQKSINWLGWNWAYFWPARIYALIVNHFVRIFDYVSAQMVEVWVCNSENVKNRIRKFYRKEAVVVYPPVEVKRIAEKTEGLEKEDYFVIVSRLFVGKGLEEAAAMASQLKVKIKISGEAIAGQNYNQKLLDAGNGYVEILGRLDDGKMYELIGKSRGFVALARDEDFGMTVVESMAAGTPVLALRSGGFVETVVDGVTGVFIDDISVGSLKKGMSKFNKIKWNRRILVEQAGNFSKEKFVIEFGKIVKRYA